MARQNDLIGAGWRFPPNVDGRGNIALVDGTEEIEEAIQIILSTPVGMRPMRPTFGSRIHELIFAPINSGTITSAIHFVRDALALWEPRIEVLDVTAEPDPEQPSILLIGIIYRILPTHDERALVYPFYTIPEEES